MTARGSIELPAPVHIRPVCDGRGERIRTSGPCLPKALPLAASVVFQRLSLRGQWRLMADVPARFTVRTSNRTSGPCASPTATKDNGL